MAKTEIKTTILLRNDSAAQWLAYDPVLALGEVGIESDTNRMKVGDGDSKWSELSYIGNTYRDSIENDGSAIGDIAVVKTEIANGKYSYTSYVWNGSAWEAMDGNYDASNVYFKDDLLTTAAIGNITLSGGQATISAKGKNLNDVWETIFVKEDTGSYISTNPSLTVSGTGTVYLEIGTETSKSVTVSLNEDGKYKYGYGYVASAGESGIAAGTPAVSIVNNNTTGVAATNFSLTYNGATTEANDGVFTLASGKATAKAEKQATVKMSYSDGYNPVSNLKKIYPDKRIKAGTTSASNSYLFRWYVPMYHGFTYSSSVVADPAKVSADTIKGLSKIKDETAYNQTKPTTATASSAWRQYFVAVPSALVSKVPTAKDGNGIDCTVKEAESIKITYDNTEVTYRVFYINNAADYGTLTVNVAW